MSVTSSSQQQALSLGGNVVLTCSVSFPETLMGNVTSFGWTHGGSAVTAEADTDLISGSSMLMVTVLTVADAGEYACTTSVSSPYLDLAPVDQTVSKDVFIQGELNEM